MGRNARILRKIPFGFIKATLFCAVFVLSSSLYYIHIFNRENTNNPKVFRYVYSDYNTTDKSFLIYTPGCKIPKLNPFDFTVRKFYRKIPDNYDCGPKDPLFRVKEHGTVTIDESVLYKQHNVYLNETTCIFYPITRKNSGAKPDDSFVLGKEHIMIFNLPIDDDFILLKCKNGNETFASDILPLTPIKPNVEERCEAEIKNKGKHKGKLNIIIVGIDSISKLNFLRYFRETLHLLRNNLSAIELNGYTKVADNTYPNLIPLLTGRHRNNYKPLEKRFGFYDDVDFIWKIYSDIGYRTLFSEDAPHMGTFVLSRRGFKKPPTDYYTHPFSIAVQTLNITHNKHCIGSTLNMKVYFDYLINYVTSMGDRPIFTFTFLAGLTHDDFTYAGYANKPSYELIKDLKDTGIFNKSLFIFFSDHGIRFGDILQTYIGKIEVRMPFIFLVFPDWFLKQNPEFSRNLEINKYRLTTPYDVHATLLHLLEPDKTDFFTLHGQSLLTEISHERTCADASISKHWCVCTTRKAVSAEDPNVQKAAVSIVKYVNKLLGPFTRNCATLKMAKILDARVSESNEKFLEVVMKDYLITLLVIPSNAVLEATVQVKNKQFLVSDEVSRNNKYGNESICVEDAVIKKYCYCKIHLRHR